MPEYLEPLNGVSLSEAMAEAATYAPITRAILTTLELWHPIRSSPVRVVVNPEGINATLEGDAPRNPGEEVPFIASNVQVELPDESDQSESPELRVRMSNVTRQLKGVLDSIRDSEDPDIRDAQWQLIERIYASDDLTGPARLPVLSLALKRVQIQGNTAELVAAYRDSANTSIPAQTFTPESYPSLQP